jgi:hypothetical protein
MSIWLCHSEGSESQRDKHEGMDYKKREEFVGLRIQTRVRRSRLSTPRPKSSTSAQGAATSTPSASPTYASATSTFEASSVSRVRNLSSGVFALSDGCQVVVIEFANYEAAPIGGQLFAHDIP